MMTQIARIIPGAALLFLFGISAAYGQVPACSDVFPGAITEDANPPNALNLPPFPDPNDGEVEWESNVTLSAGIYYFEELEIKKDVKITLAGPVLIFVEGDIDIGKNVVINVPGNPADFVLIGYDDMEIGKDTMINGILYADDDIEIDKDVRITGAITSTDEVETKKNTQVTYDPDAVVNADFGGLCDNGAVPEAELVAEWRMDEAGWNGTSGEIVDSSGNGNDGTAQTGGGDNSLPDTALGKVCRAGRFRGQGFSPDDPPPYYVDAQHYASVPDAPSLSPLISAGAMSLGGWFRMEERRGRLIHKGEGGSSQEYRVSVSGNRLRFTLWDRWGGPSSMTVSSHSLSTDTWYFYAITVMRLPGFDDVLVHGYLYDESGQIGAVSERVLSVDYTNKQTGGRLFLAAESFGGTPVNFFEGLLDEMRVYSGILKRSEIDDFWAGTRSCQAGHDHIRLLHSETGLTCSPSTITVKACANADCTLLYSNPVDVDFTSPASTWTPDPITFTGSTQVSLQYTTPGWVTLDAVAIDPAAANPTRCFTTGGVETNCGMQFFDSGFEISIPDHVADSVVNGTIAAVRSDPGNPEQCVPGFSNETKDVSFWSQYFDPGTGSLQAGIDGSAIATASPGTGIPIAFDSSGVGSFQLQYPDVGRVAVNASYVGSGDEAGLVMTGSDEFVARPAYFTLDIPGNKSATDETGDVFMTAGRKFEITVAARNANNGITPNFGRESTPEDVGLELALVAPAGGMAPGLSGNFGTFGFNCDGNSTTAGTACGRFFWPEVGIISLNPRLKSGAYLGTVDVVGSQVNHVGRFIPDHFELGSGEIIDRAGLGGCDASPFTYIGERFDVEFTLYARNAHGATTANYEGAFGFLDGGDLNLSGSPSPEINGETIAWLGGAGDARARLALPRSSPEGPYPTYDVITAPVDSDGVALLGRDDIDSTKLRFGRIVIDNAIGSELGPLGLPWRAEYWDGSTWLTNSDDDCTSLDLASEVQLASSGGDAGDGTAPVSLGGGTTSIDAGESDLTLAAGTGSIRFSTPGAAGWVDAFLELDTGWNYLRDDLNDDGAYDDNPQARASFGLFDGNSQRIYIREIMPQ